MNRKKYKSKSQKKKAYRKRKIYKIKSWEIYNKKNATLNNIPLEILFKILLETKDGNAMIYMMCFFPELRLLLSRNSLIKKITNQVETITNKIRYEYPPKDLRLKEICAQIYNNFIVNAKENYKLVFGVKHGIYKITSNGYVVEECNYDHGIKHGSWLVYHFEKETVLAHLEYVFGNLKGKAKFYNIRGVLTFEANFE